LPTACARLKLGPRWKSGKADLSSYFGIFRVPATPVAGSATLASGETAVGTLNPSGGFHPLSVVDASLSSHT
jgi:hypothetical protein